MIDKKKKEEEVSSRVMALEILKSIESHLKVEGHFNGPRLLISLLIASIFSVYLKSMRTSFSQEQKDC